jgi:hypothetical protein
MDHSKCRLTLLATHASETRTLTSVHVEPMRLTDEVDNCDACMEGTRSAGRQVPERSMSRHAAVRRRQGGGNEAREKGEMFGFTEGHFGKVGEGGG